jgi:hypothetical protein
MDITIFTDGILTNTKLTVDGKDITKNNKVVSMSLYAHAPYKSSVTDEVYSGGVNVDYAILDDKGTIERKSLGSTDANFVRGIGQKFKQNDSVVQYIGQTGDVALLTLVDKIVKHCTDNKLESTRYTKEALCLRSKESLEDLAKDLNVKLED